MHPNWQRRHRWTPRQLRDLMRRNGWALMVRLPDTAIVPDELADVRELAVPWVVPMGFKYVLIGHERCTPLMALVPYSTSRRDDCWANAANYLTARGWAVEVLPRRPWSESVRGLRAMRRCWRTLDKAEGTL